MARSGPLLKIMVIALLAVVAVSMAIWWLAKTASDEGSTESMSSIRVMLEQAAQEHAVDYPLYYPSDNLPIINRPRFSLEGNSSVYFSIGYSENVIHITEQRRPPIMEEVNKIKEFLTPEGEAYIADFDGRTAGFLVTEDTLIIATSTGTTDEDALQDTLTGMVQL